MFKNLREQGVLRLVRKNEDARRLEFELDDNKNTKREAKIKKGF